MADHSSCHELLSSITDYVDGSLKEELCLELERHMEDCENCRIVVDTLRKTISLYQETVPSPDVPSPVKRRLFQRLNLEEYLDD